MKTMLSTKTCVGTDITYRDNDGKIYYPNKNDNLLN